MRTYPYRVSGSPVDIYVPETEDDLRRFEEWARLHSMEYIGLDTETTGVDLYVSDFKVRTVQFASEDEAWVLPIDERSEVFIRAARQIIHRVLNSDMMFVLHNTTFDIIALKNIGLVDDLVDFHKRCVDTYLMAHILDPREAGQDMSAGHGLKTLCQKWVDWRAADTQDGLTEVFRKQFKKTKNTGWGVEGLTLDSMYLTYAGLDPIYTLRLLHVLGPMLRRRGHSTLYNWEMEVQRTTMLTEYRGILLDMEYTEMLHAQLLDEAEAWAERAREFGVENVNSTTQVAEALVKSGVKLTKQTATGKPSVSSSVLLPLAGLDPTWTEIEGVKPHPVAEAVIKSKRAAKWNKAYVEAFLSKRDRNDRVHPGINSLAARTARMSISNPPLQQLPSKDWKIRRCFIADEGHVFISTDFSQVELRVIAADAGVSAMIDAIKTGVDLHDRTATLIWGENFTKKQRGLGKSVAFGKIFGAGASKIAQTAGISDQEAREVVRAFNKAYPEIDAWSETLIERAEENHHLVTTYFGRELPVSPHKMYAALNYNTQSTARDLFARAMQRVVEYGYGDRISLMIHDELLHQAPRAMVDEQAAKVAKLMHDVYRGVPIDADSEVSPTRSWAGLYGCPPELDRRFE